jgi:hypothetical protein
VLVAARRVKAYCNTSKSAIKTSTGDGVRHEDASRPAVRDAGETSEGQTMSEVRIHHRILPWLIILCLTTRALPAAEPRLPLTKAAHAGDLDLTRKLLTEGQSQYARNAALEHAINAGHRDVMELLIAHGAQGAL